MKKLFLLFFIGLSFLLTAQEAPNIIFILADDMGWNGTSVQMIDGNTETASDYYVTPAIQDLANAGMTFSRAYAPASKCSPTRCSVLTGQTTIRNKFTETSSLVPTGEKLIAPSSSTAIDVNDTTIGEWLHDTNLGYRTAHFGKWHLRSMGTNNNGFDEGDGNTDNNDGVAADGMIPQNDPKKIFDLTNRSIAFMQTAVTDDVPFYVQISHYAVHDPIEATPTSIANMPTAPANNVHDDSNFGAMTQDFDASLSQLMAEIANLEAMTNRPFYIIFMSDNGSLNGVSPNTPLRRGKTFIYEGGIRVPFIVKGPNIPAGTYSDEPIVGYDLFPTIADWVQTNTGNTRPLPTDLDGQSIAPILRQETFSRTEPLYFHSPHYSTNPNKLPRSAAIIGQYKLIVNFESGQNELFDVVTNISEDTDIAGSHPDITRDLCIQLRDHLKETNGDLPALDPTHADFSGLGGTATDVDNDGLEDAWEFRELLSYTFGPTDDPDGDGMNNLAEFNAGTDPYINETVLAINETTQLNATILTPQKVGLTWTKTNTTTVDSYEIERSLDAINWSVIGKMENDTHQFIDKNPIAGFSYYRLKITYENGSIDYSARVLVELLDKNWLLLYPNPTKDAFTIRFSYPFESYTMMRIEITTMDGKLVRSFKRQKAEQLFFDVESLTSGVYLVTVFEEQQQIGSHRVLVKSGK